jgi:hypothetical protein
MTLLPLTTVLLRGVGLKTTCRVLGGLTRVRDVPAPTLEEAQDLARRVAWVSRRRSLLPAACLPRSLVVWALLRLQGADADLRIGVRTPTDAFEAHAWVEWLGVALAESEDAQASYATFDLAPEHLGVRRTRRHGAATTPAGRQAGGRHPGGRHPGGPRRPLPAPPRRR